VAQGVRRALNLAPVREAGRTRLGLRSAGPGWLIALLFAGVLLGGCLGVAGAPEDGLDGVAVGLDGGRGGGGGASSDAGALDAGVETDGGTTLHLDGGDGGGDGVDAGMPTFVAQGHLGRITLSCDLGRSWVAEQSDVGPLDRCWTTPPDGGVEYECDHQPNAGRGIAWGGGWWVANFGWGPVGTVRRSRDGVAWERVDAGQNFASMVWAGGGFLAAAESPKRSADLGRSWTQAGVIPDVWTALGNVRRGGGGELGGAIFVLAADKGIAVGRPRGGDGGVDWTVPSVPATCRAPMTQGGVVVAQGRVVLLSGDGVACVSTEGVTFQTAPVGGKVSSHLVFDGARFRAWGTTTAGTAAAFESTDGLAWTATPTRLAGMSGAPDIGPVAFGAGVFVAVTGEWRAWYDAQRFYRSTDGVAWEVLAPGTFAPGHPIINIAFGGGGECR
jgi:hypothetical protein